MFDEMDDEEDFEGFMVQVVEYFVSEINDDDLSLGELDQALKCDRWGAYELAREARLQFPEEPEVFVARHNVPYISVETTLKSDPVDFIVVIGRQFLESARAQIKTSFVLMDAKRFTRLDAELQAIKIRIKDEQPRVYVANQATPFMEVTDGAATRDDTGTE